MRQNIRYAGLAALALVAGASAVIAGASPAAAFDYPYCLQGKQTGIPGDCNYASYAQCMAPLPDATPIARSIRVSRSIGRRRASASPARTRTITTIDLHWIGGAKTAPLIQSDR